MIPATGDLPLGEISDVATTAAWREETAFSGWLATNLQRLGVVLGLGDLELIGTEIAAGDFRCDIIARESDNSSVSRTLIIENQFTKTDHDHLGELLTYAARHTAQIIVWISPEIRDEHRAAIDWLNKMTPEEIGFFAVQLRIIKIDNSRPAPFFEVRASPNVWVKPTVDQTVSPRGESYRQFFQALIDELREHHRFTNVKTALPQNWYSFATGVRGFQYSATFASGQRARAELFIDLGNQDLNKAAYDRLYEQQSELQEKIGTAIDWERLNHRRGSRIALTLAEASIDQAASKGPDMQKWLVEKLLLLKAAFGPRLADAKAFAEAAVPSANAAVDTAEPGPKAMEQE